MDSKSFITGLMCGQDNAGGDYDIGDILWDSCVKVNPTEPVSQIFSTADIGYVRYMITDSNNNLYVHGVINSDLAIIIKFDSLGVEKWRVNIEGGYFSQPTPLAFIDNEESLIVSVNYYKMVKLSVVDGSMILNVESEAFHNWGIVNRSLFIFKNSIYFISVIDGNTYNYEIRKYTSDLVFVESYPFTFWVFNEGDDVTEKYYYLDGCVLDSEESLYLIGHSYNRAVNNIVKINLSTMTVSWIVVPLHEIKTISIGNDGFIYTAIAGNITEKYNTNGELIWSRPLGIGYSYTHDTPMVDSLGNAYVCRDCPGFVKGFIVVDKDNNEKWSELKYGFTTTSVLGSDNNLYVAVYTIYSASYNDPSGASIVKYPLTHVGGYTIIK